jgi:hypothetical protein
MPSMSGTMVASRVRTRMEKLVTPSEADCGATPMKKVQGA